MKKWNKQTKKVEKYFSRLLNIYLYIYIYIDKREKLLFFIIHLYVKMKKRGRIFFFSRRRIFLDSFFFLFFSFQTYFHINIYTTILYFLHILEIKWAQLREGERESVCDTYRYIYIYLVSYLEIQTKITKKTDNKNV